MRPIRTEADIEEGVKALTAIAPEFAPVAKAAGPVPLRYRPPGFEGLAHIIVSQMISRTAADAIWLRLSARLGDVAAENLVCLSPEELRATGLSGAKEATLRRLAEACLSGLDLEAIASAPGDVALARLREVKGIGPWTAEVFLLFSAGHPDIFPAGDVALQAAFTHAFGLEKRPTEKHLRVHSARWQPLRSIAARLLWAYYAREVRRDVTPVA